MNTLEITQPDSLITLEVALGVPVSAINLEDLQNVNIVDPQEGDVLVYQSGVWTNQQP
jgi:hypothetical protein